MERDADPSAKEDMIGANPGPKRSAASVFLRNGTLNRNDID